MVKLPVLQKLLNREKTENVKTDEKKKEKTVIVSTGYYAGMNFVLLINEWDQYDMSFRNTLKNKFKTLMESDLFVEDVIKKLELFDIYVEDYYLLEGIMFILFKKEL